MVTRRQCRRCGEWVAWVDSPTGGWYAHFVHPADDHDADVLEDANVPLALLPEELDNVNHPPHYTGHPSGVECITITEHMGFNLGNAVKYIWRADLKNDAVEDLRKARWYIDRELKRRGAE